MAERAERGSAEPLGTFPPIMLTLRRRAVAALAALLLVLPRGAPARSLPGLPSLADLSARENAQEARSLDPATGSAPPTVPDEQRPPPAQDDANPAAQKCIAGMWCDDDAVPSSFRVPRFDQRTLALPGRRWAPVLPPIVVPGDAEDEAQRNEDREERLRERQEREMVA